MGKELGLYQTQRKEDGNKKERKKLGLADEAAVGGGEVAAK